MRKMITRSLWAVIVCLNLQADGAEDLELIEVPRFRDVKSQVLDEVASRKLTEDIKQQVGALWVADEEVPVGSESYVSRIPAVGVIVFSGLLRVHHVSKASSNTVF